MISSREIRLGMQMVWSASLAIAVYGFTGCGKPAGDKAKGGASAGHSHDEYAHAEKGPHAGALIELGEEEYHAELIHDDANHKVGIHLLDSKAASSVPIAATEIMVNLMVEGKPTQFALKAVPEASDGAGKASHFELVDQKLCEALDSGESFAQLSVTIDGKPFIGKLEHHDHDHGHDHGHSHDHK